MQALVDQPELRATILEPTTGVRRKIGMRKSPISAAEDLQFALDERETDAATILQLFRADDRVRHLESTDLWAFVIEGEYWKDVPKDGKERKKLERHYAFMLAQALENGLVDALGGEDVAKAWLVEQGVSADLEIVEWRERSSERGFFPIPGIGTLAAWALGFDDMDQMMARLGADRIFLDGLVSVWQPDLGHISE